MFTIRPAITDWSHESLVAYVARNRSRVHAAIEALAGALAALAEKDLDEAVRCARRLRAACQHSNTGAYALARQLAISLECRQYDRRPGVPRRRMLDRYQLQERLRHIDPHAGIAALTSTHDQALGLFAQFGLITASDHLAAI